MTRMKRIVIALSAVLLLSSLFAACSAKDANPETIFLSVTNEAVDFC